MKVSEIIDIIEDFAPKSLALDFDNVGLLVGDKDDKVTGISVALDVTELSIRHCIDHHCNLLITHHPIIFNPIKSVTNDTYTGRLLKELIKNNINVYCAHTNMDNADRGINFELAKELGLRNVECLADDDCGVCGDCNITTNELKTKIKDIIRNDNMCFYNSIANKEIKRIAVIGGAGGRDNNLPSLLKEKGIDTFISGEFKYNLILELTANGINVVNVGHNELEIIFLSIMCDLLEGKVERLTKCFELPYVI